MKQLNFKKPKRYIFEAMGNGLVNPIDICSSPKQIEDFIIDNDFEQAGKLLKIIKENIDFNSGGLLF